MTQATANAEELFRFATARAPNPTPAPAGLLELPDESNVAAWIASAANQDFTAQLETLTARWSALVKRTPEAIDADLNAARQGQLTLAADTLFPIAQSAPAEVTPLQNDLWQFHLQGIASGKASTAQLQRAQQLLGQVTLLQKLVAGDQNALSSASVQAALAPALKLPAAFEEQMRLRREQQHAQQTVAGDNAAEEEDAILRDLLKQIDTLVLLEKRLIAALDQIAGGGAHTPGMPGTGSPSELQKVFRIQPAADIDAQFRADNANLIQELADANVPTATLGAYELLDDVRRRISNGVAIAAGTPATGPEAAAVLAASPELGQLLPTAPVSKPAPAPGMKFGIRPVGVADLRVVRQVLVGYEKGELANIHNVLQGEEHEHFRSRLSRADESQGSFNDGDAEFSQEETGFNRFELGQSAFQTARNQQDRNASINLTTNYGAVNAQASTFMNNSRGGDQSRGNDVRQSRDLVDRAVTLVRERVGRQRFLTRSAEVYQSDMVRHCAPAANVRAQYRWVDKVYQAQVFTYGARAMYEVMVPAPAAMFRHLLARQPGFGGHAGPAPIKPTLRPAEITDASWLAIADRFDVTLPPPPTAAITEYASLTYPSGSGATPAVSGVFNSPVALEQGYAATAAGVSMAWYGVENQSGITASIGTRLFSSSPAGSTPIAAQTIGTNSGAVSYNASGWGQLDQFTVNFYLVWTRTKVAVEKWQLTCHQIIMDQYESDLKQQHARLAAARADEKGPYAALGEEQMRTIERTELKRAVLEIVRSGSGRAAPASPIIQGAIPAIAPERLEQAAREVRFFEYAFEWDQLTYSFFPYFWSEGSQQWAASRFEQQGDSVFTAFLNAGFASVILPVRSGYEDAAALYLQTGIVSDIAVVPADQVLADLNREVQLVNRTTPMEGTPEGAAWAYRVPTTLMVLDDGTDIAFPKLAVPAGQEETILIPPLVIDGKPED
ncbi:hypothetical protein CR152_28880 [Massilia violaceinigra]|uniref:Uncharacterized protein n=1 Tax=Massilia violaceinigra TaxID=2045208 RepID=A0A2D2DSZ3_9BURK|nr:hypothetical protein [Massilia violaceinigra]ATQ78076.1 hypothetical protein CR152_28880 [Massilia violaceinigra]